jgi:hypothetical protein
VTDPLLAEACRDTLRAYTLLTQSPTRGRIEKWRRSFGYVHLCYVCLALGGGADAPDCRRCPLSLRRDRFGYSCTEAPTYIDLEKALTGGDPGKVRVAAVRRLIYLKERFEDAGT